MKLKLLVAIAMSMTVAAEVQAQQDFRVETDIFIEGIEEPVAQTITLFSEGVVYDFLSEESGEEITIFDPKRGRITLLNTSKKLQTKLVDDAILSFVSQMKAFLEQKNQSALANPMFEETTNEETGWVVLTSDDLDYEFRGKKPRHDEAVEQYQEFADWYARLNAMRRGNLPPFARLRVNAELAERGQIPLEVKRVVRVKRGLRTTTQTASSKHLFTWTLSESDRRRINKAGSSMASYRSVRFTEYVGIDGLAAQE